MMHCTDEERSQCNLRETTGERVRSVTPMSASVGAGATGLVLLHWTE